MNIPKTTIFSLDEVEIDSIKKAIDNLDSIKSGTFGGIPPNCLNGVSDISGNFLHAVWNDEVLKDLKFPSGLKLADVVSAFKKEESILSDSNEIRTHNHLVRKRTLNYLAKLAK